jgi:hypothetical protein
MTIPLRIKGYEQYMGPNEDKIMALRDFIYSQECTKNYNWEYRPMATRFFATKLRMASFLYCPGNIHVPGSAEPRLPTTPP